MCLCGSKITLGVGSCWIPGRNFNSGATIKASLSVTCASLVIQRAVSPVFPERIKVVCSLLIFSITSWLISGSSLVCVTDSGLA